jgi:hypothetical protein
VNCGQGLRLRAIGTDDMVNAVVGANPGQNPTPDGIGYAFWGYGNFAPLVSKSNCTSTTNGNAVCSSYSAHYLAVDGVDPFFDAPGGDPTPGIAPYNLPQCSAMLGLSSASPCYQLPFTHIYDGSYPLWSVMHVVTFDHMVNGAGTTLQVAPPGVLNTIAYAQLAATQVPDIVPFLNNLTNAGTLATPNWSGSLNLGVFRSHYHQSAVNPGNGHYQLSGATRIDCNPASIALAPRVNGGLTCWQDVGGEMGGTVMSVQTDLDFINDLGIFGLPSEYYNLHQ